MSASRTRRTRVGGERGSLSVRESAAREWTAVGGGREGGRVVWGEMRPSEGK